MYPGTASQNEVEVSNDYLKATSLERDIKLEVDELYKGCTSLNLGAVFREGRQFFSLCHPSLKSLETLKETSVRCPCCRYLLHELDDMSEDDKGHLQYIASKGLPLKLSLYQFDNGYHLSFSTPEAGEDFLVGGSIRVAMLRSGCAQAATT